VRAWWRRSLIERIFGTLTDRGLKRLPSTFGSGPGDPTREDPIQMAETFRVRLNELIAIVYGCVREHNLAPTERLHGVSPVGVLRAAVSNAQHPWLPQPLTLQMKKNSWILWHAITCVVRGNPKRGRSPHVKTDHCRYYGEGLARRYDLVGKTLFLYLYRFDCRKTFAVLRDTGELLGELHPEARWARWPYTYQERKIINRAIPVKEREEKADPVGVWAREKKAQMLARKKAPGGKRARSLDALALAKHHRTSRTQPSVDANDVDEQNDLRSPQSSLPDVFGLKRGDWLRRASKRK
jgi:putative transposase